MLVAVKENGNRPSAESLLAKLNQGEQARLRVYIGAAPGVGKTYQMLEDAHLLKKLGAEPSKKLFMWCEPGEFSSIPAGKKDDTHLNAFGASRICDLATEEIRANVPELARWLVAKP